MVKNRKVKYQYRLFAVALLCIWTVLGTVAYFEYKNNKAYRSKQLSDQVTFAVGNIMSAHSKDRDIQPYMDFMRRYFAESALNDLSIAVYDGHTNLLLYSLGEIRVDIPLGLDDGKYVMLPDKSTVLRMNDVVMPDGERIFFYSCRVSADGEVVVRTFLPHTPQVANLLLVSPIFWVLMISAGLAGTILAYIITAHQAKNVKLLHEFAQRAAADRDFIPMGDFPSDEIGDISRQIVAIYNSRMQANVRREREHIIALKATEEKNKMKRVLTNNISHELKTPIGILRAYIDMLVNQPDMPDADRRHFLSKMQDNVERLVKMLNDLSTMTRLEESSSTIPMKDVDFHELIFSLAEEVVTSGMIGEMDFRYNIPLDCHVRGNEGLLNSMLNNLVKNSSAYSQGTQMGIELIGRNDKFFTFSFYDNGVGVGEEHLPHIFERFYRIDVGRSRKAGGTGLGLPIVKSAINTMGGSITVRSRHGGGLEFVFTLPRVTSGGVAASETQDSADAGTVDVPGQ